MLGNLTTGNYVYFLCFYIRALKAAKYRISPFDSPESVARCCARIQRPQGYLPYAVGSFRAVRGDIIRMPLRDGATFLAQRATTRYLIEAVVFSCALSSLKNE
jgi:hypothetical protein